MHFPEALQERCQRIGARYHVPTIEVLDRLVCLAERLESLDVPDAPAEILDVDYRAHTATVVRLFARDTPVYAR